MVNSRLTVANGHVFFRVGNSICAIDAKSGTEVWSKQIDAELSAAPTVGGDTLYVPGRTTPKRDDGDALVIALDPVSGEHKWDYSFGSWELDEYGPAAKTPVISDGRAFISTYPMYSTLDWMYTRYADFHILGCGAVTTTTAESTTDIETKTTTQTTICSTTEVETETPTGTETTTTTQTPSSQETTTTKTSSEGTTTSTSTTGQTTVHSTVTTGNDETTTKESLTSSRA